MFHFYKSWKRKKTRGFLMFSGGIEMKHWAKMGYVFRYSATTATSGTLISWVIEKAVKKKFGVDSIFCRNAQCKKNKLYTLSENSNKYQYTGTMKNKKTYQQNGVCHKMSKMCEYSINYKVRDHHQTSLLI